MNARQLLILLLALGIIGAAAWSIVSPWTFYEWEGLALAALGILGFFVLASVVGRRAG